MKRGIIALGPHPDPKRDACTVGLQASPKWVLISWFCVQFHELWVGSTERHVYSHVHCIGSNLSLPTGPKRLICLMIIKSHNILQKYSYFEWLHILSQYNLKPHCILLGFCMIYKIKVVNICQIEEQWWFCIKKKHLQSVVVCCFNNHLSQKSVLDMFWIDSEESAVAQHFRLKCEKYTTESKLNNG